MKNKSESRVKIILMSELLQLENSKFNRIIKYGNMIGLYKEGGFIGRESNFSEFAEL
jgi:hypothetical protein